MTETTRVVTVVDRKIKMNCFFKLSPLKYLSNIFIIFWFAHNSITLYIEYQPFLCSLKFARSLKLYLTASMKKKIFYEAKPLIYIFSLNCKIYKKLPCLEESKINLSWVLICVW